MGTLRWYYAQPKDDWRSLTAYLSAHALPGDAVVGCAPGTEWPVEYYQSTANPGSGLTYVTPGELMANLRKDFPAPAPARLWLIRWSCPASSSIAEDIEPQYRRMDDRHFEGTVALSLYERR